MLSGKKVLIIDDSKTERFILSQYLMKMGCTTFEAENGLEGLERAQEIMPDLICMDILMPGGFNGFQAIRAIYQKDELKHIPIILCTSKNGDTDRLWGKKQGAAAFIVKPIAEDVFVSAVKEVLKL